MEIPKSSSAFHIFFISFQAFKFTHAYLYCHCSLCLSWHRFVDIFSIILCFLIEFSISIALSEAGFDMKKNDRNSRSISLSKSISVEFHPKKMEKWRRKNLNKKNKKMNNRRRKGKRSSESRWSIESISVDMSWSGSVDKSKSASKSKESKSKSWSVSRSNERMKKRRFNKKPFSRGMKKGGSKRVFKKTVKKTVRIAKKQRKPRKHFPKKRMNKSASMSFSGSY